MPALKLAEWRRAKNISVIQMSEMLGIHENTYRKWEANPKKISLENAESISKLLGVDWSDIIFLPE